MNINKVISVVNQKGGVGKTTTAVNLSTALVAIEKKVLLIDADPQANATSGLGVDINQTNYGTYQLLEHSIEVSDAIISTNSPNLDLIPSHIDLVASEIELVNQDAREFMLKKALKSIKKDYNYILIDCAPSLGLITLNALVAADAVIIPIQCEYFALEGLGKLLNTIKSVQKLHNKELDIEGLLLTMYDTRLRLSNQVVEEVKKHFGKNFVPLIFDVTDIKKINVGVTIVKDHIGKNNLTALINNAGIAVLGPLEFIKPLEFQKQIETNLIGVFSCIQAFLPLLGSTSNKPKINNI